MMKAKLFREMTAEEQQNWAVSFGEFLGSKWPKLEAAAKAKTVVWTEELQTLMSTLIDLLMSWQFARDFCQKANQYGDYAARVYRMPLYVEKVRQQLEKIDDETISNILSAKPAGRRGRPASAETLAKREAEAKAAEQQTELFNEEQEATPETKVTGAEQSAANVQLSMFNVQSEKEYKLSIAQIRGFLSPTLQVKSDQVRTLRTKAAAASERAKTLSDMKKTAKEVESVVQEAIKAMEEVKAIYLEIDVELAILWYRLQNDSPEWKQKWCERFGFKSANDIHPDLLSDLKKHYQKVQNPGFDLRCQTLIKQESPEYIEAQKAEAQKKKEVQDILRYFRRKDKSQKVETARAKFKRLEQLIGKKEAAVYKPLLTKVEEDAKKAAQKK